MSRIPKSDHKRASLTLYYIVARNTEGKMGQTINKIGAAHILADLLQIDHRAPISWLRGEFIKHPLSRENFLKLIRAYRTKPGLENTREITALAINIYGSNYKKAIELLDPIDRESDLEQEVVFELQGESDVVTAIYSLLESSPEAIEIASGVMTTYRWTADELLKKLQKVSDETENGTDKIIHVITSQFPDDLREAFSKLGGLPELALYNLDCFETLWEITGNELTGMISVFEKLNLIRAVKDNEWKIKRQILDIARQYLEELPENIQLYAHHWWQRFLDKPKYHKDFRTHFIARYTELDGIANRVCVKKQQDEKEESSLQRFKKWFFIRVETDWECMQSFSQYMSFDNFVLAQFILIRRKRNLLFGLLISLWLGVAPLLHRFPLLMGCAISAGVYALFRLLMDLHRCDSAWAGLWDTLVMRARTARVEDED